MLSICVITRDECEKLDRLIRSLEGFKGEIVVVDTGSVDDTLVMLKEHKNNTKKYPEIKIEQFTWIDDFAAAKNYAAGKASNELVMILDSDEWLTSDLSALSEEKLKRDAVGRIKRHNIIKVAGETRINDEWINRIFSKELYEYRGKIHEQLVKKGCSEDEIYDTYLTGVEIDHDGYAGTTAEKQKKSRRNIELLILELTETGYDSKKSLGELDDEYYLQEKKVPYILYQLGKSYYMAGEYSQAAFYLGEALYFDLDERLEYVIDLVECYGYALINCGKAKDALLLAGVYDSFGGSPDFRFLMGYIYMQNAMFDEAIASFESACKLHTPRMQGTDSYLSYYNCGVIKEVLGDLKAAGEYYKKAGEYAPAKEGIKRIERGNEDPYLIIYGVRYCYNILNEILKGIENALKRKGYRVETYDEQEGDIAGLSKYVGKTYKGIFAVQTYLYSVYLEQSEKFLFDEIHGPKYNIVLDHPGWLKHLFERLPKDTHVLTHDANYRAFVEKYYKAVDRSIHFPMASDARAKNDIRKKYDVIFIGTYGDYREKYRQIYEIANPFVRHLANRYLLEMRKDTTLTAEDAFARALKYYGKECDDDTFLELFSAMNPVLSCVMYYYREKVMHTLLDGGVILDIWGSTWKKSPFASHTNLRIHEDVTREDSLAIMESAKISLNIMAWHKGGFTERMADTMAQRALLVTDKTTFFDTADDAGVEQFSLDDIAALPGRIKELLTDEETLYGMIEEGYNNAIKNHTWDVRIEQI